MTLLTRLNPPSLASVLIWAGIGIAWVLLLILHHLFHSNLWLRLLGWQIMLVAMMLPSSLPVFQSFAQLSSRWIDRAAFVLPYWGIWSAFSLLLLWQPPHSSMGMAHPQTAISLVQSVVLIGTGLFQFSPLKQSCLEGCQSAIAMLIMHYESHIISIARLGLRYALNCLGCCWALMLMMLTVGMNNIALMMALTLMMAIERQWQYGKLFSFCVGLVLVILGSVSLILHNIKILS